MKIRQAIRLLVNFFASYLKKNPNENDFMNFVDVSESGEYGFESITNGY